MIPPWWQKFFIQQQFIHFWFFDHQNYVESMELQLVWNFKAAIRHGSNIILFTRYGMPKQYSSTSWPTADEFQMRHTHHLIWLTWMQVSVQLSFMHLLGRHSNTIGNWRIVSSSELSSYCSWADNSTFILSTGSSLNSQQTECIIRDQPLLNDMMNKFVSELHHTAYYMWC